MLSVALDIVEPDGKLDVRGNLKSTLLFEAK
jgi:hypothetical protein